MNDTEEQPRLKHDINFELNSNGYQILFSDRIAEDHPCLVEQCADWLEDEVRVVNLGTIEHKALHAFGVHTEQIERDVAAWWALPIKDLDQG